MKHARRLLFNLNVGPQKLKNLFSIMGLTFCCIFTAFSQSPCDTAPFDIDSPLTTEVIDGTIDFSTECTSTSSIEAGGEYEVTLAANTSYTFTVCENSDNDFPNVEFWSDQTTFVASFTATVAGDCVEYSYNSCEAGPVFLVVYQHDCIGNWVDFELNATCTTCTISCIGQTESLDMSECDITGLQLNDPTVTGSCFTMADLVYKIDIDDDGDFDEETAVAHGTAVDGLDPGCYDFKWFYEDADCPVESTSCRLCVNSVNLTCKGGTRQYTSTSACSSEIRIEHVLKTDVCEDTEGADCFKYEISINGTDWFEDAIAISALGTYNVMLRVTYFSDCADDTSDEFTSMISCFTAEVINNTAPICSLGDKSTVHYCGTELPTETPTFTACGTDPIPTFEDSVLGDCGTYVNGDTNIDLNTLNDGDGNGFADAFENIGLDIVIPDDYPSNVARGSELFCNFDVLNIIQRTWTATADNGLSGSCSEYIFVLAPDISCVMVDPYEAECTGDGTEDLSVAALIAIDVKFGPYYTLPDGETNVSLIGQHDNCKISLSQKEDTGTDFSCPVKSKFLRKWHLIDWCDPSDPQLLTQLVKTVDTTAPTYDEGACPGDDDEGGKNNEINLTITSNCAIIADLSAFNPPATDLCCDVDNYTIEVFGGTEALLESGGGDLETGEGTMFSFTKGFYRADYTVADACGNTSTVCSKYFEVNDGITPSAHCNAPTIDLDSNLEAMLCADVIGAGSTDNCSVALLEIGLMPLDGSDPIFVSGCVNVTCDFVNPANSTVMIAIRATDGCGLTSISMCEAPVKNVISIDCALLDNPLVLNCNDYVEDMPIGTQPILSTTCEMPNAEIRISDTDLASGNGCGNGTLIRTYTVFVDNVETNTFCVQNITLTEPDIEITCPTQPTPTDCDIDNFAWVDPILENSDLLCDDNVSIVARVPDEIDDSTLPIITVTRTWDITRVCDGFATTCASIVVFNDCCPLIPEEVVRIGSFSNPNEIVLREIPGTTVDWSLYTFEICSSDEDEVINGAINQNPIIAPTWSVLGGAETTGIRVYQAKYWFGTLADRPAESCPGPQVTGEESIGTTTSRVAGKIINEENVVVEEVMVDLQNSTEPVDMTDTEGVYDFPEVLTGQNYAVVPSKDSGPLNGVSTYDLVLISQHIIGQNQLSSPYKLIAADVNNDGKITTFDIVQLRQLILFAVSDFGANTSWRFIDAAYVFPDPTDPWSETLPEQYNITNLEQDMLVDFIAVKVGDVNCSAITNNLTASNSRGGNQLISLKAYDKALDAGESNSIVVTASELQSLISFQFTIGFNTNLVEIQNVNTLNENLSQDHFGTNLITEGAITFGWHNTKAVELEGQLFEIEFTAKRNLFLKDVFSVNSTFTEAVAYNEVGEESSIELVFDNELSAPINLNDFKVEQNKPNPFKDETVIGFEIPADSKVTLTVFNVDGKVLSQTHNSFTAGVNAITISKDELNATGVLYYQLDTEVGSATRKMIVINN